MQGYLSEIDIRSILQLIELGQRTGVLYLESYGVNPASVSSRNGDLGLDPLEVRQSWLVFFANGGVVYAGTNDNSLSRLQDHLQACNLGQFLPEPRSISAIATLNSLEYGTLWLMLEQHLLTLDQGRAILSHMIEETLFDLLSLHHGSFVFQLSPALSPQLMTHSLSNLVVGLTQKIQAWHQLHGQFQSPDQVLLLVDAEGVQSCVPDFAYRVLVREVNGKTSLRQFARFLNQDLVTVAESLREAIQQGYITVKPAQIQPSAVSSRQQSWFDRLPRIVCVDDSATIRETVESILESHGYEATSIANPLKALGLLFQLQPDLILCDIAMPELDGYELCAMLRQASVFRQTPIVMLTGKEAFLDRVKARMVGATDYLTKPFGPGELIALVEKYIGSGVLANSHPDKLLVEAMAAEWDLEVDR
ncbi:MAG: response regulator [Nodosilinea sp. LVE1205-7]|jgi:twitching motility two-component system response regulator PilG